VDEGELKAQKAKVKNIIQKLKLGVGIHDLQLSNNTRARLRKKNSLRNEPAFLGG
jgi:hypothetical protein